MSLRRLVSGSDASAVSLGATTAEPRSEAAGHGRLPRGLAAVTVVAMLVVGLGACGPSSNRTAAISLKSEPGKVVHLTWWVQWGSIYFKLIQKMTSVWNRSHPDIRVNVISVPTNGDQKLLAAIAAGDPPDIFTENDPYIGQYASKKYIEPLNRFFTGKYADAESWLYGPAADWAKYGGKLYGYPISMNSWLLFYNKDLMKAAGLDPNRPPKTIARLDADQAKEWKIDNSHVEQEGFYPGSFDFFMAAFNVHLYKHGHWDIANNANALKEMKWIASYDRYPYSSISAFNASLGSLSTDPFDTGKVGFYIQGPWQIPENKTNDPSMKWGVEAVPAPPGGVTDTTWINGNYNIIPKGSKHPKQAWEFTAWFAGFDNLAFAAKYLPQGGWIPDSGQITKQSRYQKYIKSTPGLSAFVKVFNNPKDGITPVTCNEAEYENYMGNAVQFVQTKKMTAKAALRYVQKNVDKSAC